MLNQAVSLQNTLKLLGERFEKGNNVDNVYFNNVKSSCCIAKHFKAVNPDPNPLGDDL